MIDFERVLVVSGLFLLQLTGCATSGVTKISDFRITRNIVYTSVEGKDLLGDLYQPKLPGLKPAVIVVHGGGWSSRNGLMTQVAEDLARSGFTVFNIQYRLSPESLYPKPVEDVLAAVRFIETHAPAYEIDAQRLSAWGYSAGAHLTLLVGLDPTHHLKALVSGGTPADFLAWPHSPIVKKFIGASLREKPEVWKEASPVNHVVPGSPPVFLYHGKKDDLVEIEQMEKMKKALEAKHVPVETYTSLYLGHIPVYLFSQESIVRGIEFLKRQLDYHP